MRYLAPCASVARSLCRCVRRTPGSLRMSRSCGSRSSSVNSSPMLYSSSVRPSSSLRAPWYKGGQQVVRNVFLEANLVLDAPDRVALTHAVQHQDSGTRTPNEPHEQIPQDHGPVAARRPAVRSALAAVGLHEARPRVPVHGAQASQAPGVKSMRVRDTENAFVPNAVLRPRASVVHLGGAARSALAAVRKPAPWPGQDNDRTEHGACCDDHCHQPQQYATSHQSFATREQ
mmetsp:Transcript_47329/g.143921  ORF Transcript_47329/g.143921 Transcript_47329/m.143921 type:complete len:231 (+) Transcript_47329:64-756(+)